MKFTTNSLNGAMATDWPIGLTPKIDDARRTVASNAAISSKLKKVYSDVLNEPMPDNFARLLDQLDTLSQARDDR